MLPASSSRIETLGEHQSRIYIALQKKKHASPGSISVKS